MSDPPGAGYTVLPNTIFCAMPDIDGSELRVLLAVVRRTFGWRKDEDVISLSQFQADTGLSRQGVIEGISHALTHGTIARTPARRGGFSYRLAGPSYQSLVNSGDQSDATSQLSRPVTGLLSRLVDAPLVNSVDQSLVNSVDTQKTYVKKRIKRALSRATTGPVVDGLKALGLTGSQASGIVKKNPGLSVEAVDKWADWKERSRAANPTALMIVLLRDGQTVPPGATNGHRNGTPTTPILEDPEAIRRLQEEDRRPIEPSRFR